MKTVRLTLFWLCIGFLIASIARSSLPLLAGSLLSCAALIVADIAIMPKRRIR